MIGIRIFLKVSYIVKLISHVWQILQIVLHMFRAICTFPSMHLIIERSIKLTFNGFLFVCCWDHFVCIFFSISVNNEQVFAP